MQMARPAAVTLMSGLEPAHCELPDRGVRVRRHLNALNVARRNSDDTYSIEVTKPKFCLTRITSAISLEPTAHTEINDTNTTPELFMDGSNGTSRLADRTGHVVRVDARHGTEFARAQRRQPRAVIR